MKNTIHAADAARGLTVLFMPSVHTVMMYSLPSVHTSWLGYLMIFFAEGPGAQLFMLLMGFFVAIGKPKSRRKILTRSVLLFLAGYGLNFFRAVLPALFGLLPADMLASYQIENNHPPFLPLLLTGDILQFAGIGYCIISFVQQMRYRIYVAAIGYVVIALVSPFSWGLQCGYPLPDHLLSLLCAKDNQAFFPVFPWLCYPLAGLLAGWYHTYTEKTIFYKKINTAGLVLIISGIGVAFLTPAYWDIDFYRSSPGRTISQTGFILMWLSLSHLLLTYFPAGLFHRVLFFCSRQISPIYLIQWIVIGWGIGVAGYHRLSMLSSLVAVAVVNLITFGITCLLANYTARANSKSAVAH